MLSNSVIQLNRISKSFGKSTVLKDVSIQIMGGKFYALLGKNGAGKSTLMRIIMRYEQPDSGNGRIFNQALDSDAEDLNLYLGYVSEALDYSLSLPIYTFFSFFSGIYPRWDQQLFDDVLKRLKIDQSKFFHELSRGQKMQVAFAVAIATRPKVIIRDEITAVLDANARSYFMSYLSKFTKEGGTVIMATNIVSEVQHYADHLILIDDGAIRFDQSLSEVSKKFTKLRRQQGQEHPVFQDPLCIEVGVSSDKSISYLIDGVRPKKYPIDEELHDKRAITAEDLFIYFTRSEVE